MARKRESRNKQCNRKDADHKLPNNDDNFIVFCNQLSILGLTLREVPGDGNCLFRALGDQLEGHGRNHLKHRHDTVVYVRNHRQDFEPFVEDDLPFDKHVDNLAKSGTYAGNDAIVAFARLHGVKVVIHQLNTPLWYVPGTESSKKNSPELHIAYHNGDHYSSIRRIGDDSECPANIQLNMTNSENSSVVTLPCTSPKQSFYEINSQLEEEGGFQSEIVESVMEKTGCKDALLIQDTLESQNYDLNITIGCILDFMANSDEDNSLPELSSIPNASLWGPQGTGTRLFGCPSETEAQSNAAIHEKCQGAKPKPSNIEPVQTRLQSKTLNAKKTRQQKDKERKQRREERRRQKQTDRDGSCTDVNTATTPIAAKFVCLSI